MLEYTAWATWSLVPKHSSNTKWAWSCTHLSVKIWCANVWVPAFTIVRVPTSRTLGVYISHTGCGAVCLRTPRYCFPRWLPQFISYIGVCGSAPGSLSLATLDFLRFVSSLSLSSFLFSWLYLCKRCEMYLMVVYAFPQRCQMSSGCALGRLSIFRELTTCESSGLICLCASADDPHPQL